MLTGKDQAVPGTKSLPLICFVKEGDAAFPYNMSSKIQKKLVIYIHISHFNKCDYAMIPMPLEIKYPYYIFHILYV